jgi:hypothetical protein
MDLADATLMLMTESAGYPSVARLAESAYLELVSGRPAPHHLLSELIREASDKGVLLDLRVRYSREAYLAMIEPICKEIGELAPVPPYPRRTANPSRIDPLTADLGELRDLGYIS